MNLRSVLFAVLGLALAAPAHADFLDTLDTYDTALFQKADGWTNGSPFNCGWRADHVTFSGGLMTLTLDNVPCPAGCSGKPYASGEYRTAANYGYGRIEARFKAAKASGIIAASLFTYTGPSAGDPWDEIDIEILGKDTTKMQANYFTDGVGGHETVISLGFDAAADFHVYAFEWTSSAIRWYVDGALVLTETGSRGPLPTHPGKIMVNMWPGSGVNAWLGRFSYAGPLFAQYDYVRYTAAVGGTPAPTPTPSGGLSTSAWYVLTNQASRRCVDARGAGAGNGAPVQQYSCSGTYPQQWQFQSAGDGYYKVVNRNAPTMVWDVAGSGSGALIQVWTDLGMSNQQWLAEPVGADYHRLRARHSGMCLEVPGGSTTNGVQLQQADCDGSTRQSFRLEQK